MTNLKHFLMAVVAIPLTGACAAAPPTSAKWEANFLALTDEHFSETVDIVDDPLNPSIEINTRAAHRDYQYALDLQNDQFLRANIFRKTGTVVIQGYVVSESYDDFLAPTTISFSTGMETKTVDRLGFDVKCNSFGACRHIEDMVFQIGQEELENTITAMEESGEAVLGFRVQGQKGWDRDGRFHIGEMRAMLEAVKSHSAATH